MPSCEKNIFRGSHWMNDVLSEMNDNIVLPFLYSAALLEFGFFEKLTAFPEFFIYHLYHFRIYTIFWGAALFEYRYFSATKLRAFYF